MDSITRPHVGFTIEEAQHREQAAGLGLGEMFDLFMLFRRYRAVLGSAATDIESIVTKYGPSAGSFVVELLDILERHKGSPVGDSPLLAHPPTTPTSPPTIS